MAYGIIEHTGKFALITLVHITTVPWSFVFIRGQGKFMESRRLAVTAVSSAGDELGHFGASEGIATRSVEMRRAIAPIHDFGAICRLVHTLNSIRPTIVHAHTPKGGLVGMIAAWLTRTPVRVYHIRGLPYMTASGRRRIILKWTERISCKLAHQVFCVSHSIREIAITDGICPADKVMVFLGGSGNGVDAANRFNPDRFPVQDRAALRTACGIDREEMVIGFVGRVVRDKGIEELATAWKSIKKTHPNARLLLVGPREPQDPVAIETLAGLMNDRRVRFVGDVNDTSKYYAMLDLVALPTYREGFPNVPLEAASMGVPVVATNIPGCVDAVQDGVTGTLVPPRDAEALQEAIEMYLNDPDLRAKHGKAGRERVLRDFRQEDIWEAIYQEYVRLLTERGIPVPVPVKPT